MHSAQVPGQIASFTRNSDTRNIEQIINDPALLNDQRQLIVDLALIVNIYPGLV